MAHKKYVLDTSILVHDSKCLSVFEDNDIIIPIAVLEELDHLKTRSDSVGSNARIMIRKIDEYCENKDIRKGIDIGNDINMFIDVEHDKDPRFNAGGKDDCILACAASYKSAILVSKDINMRVRARAYGIRAEDYTNDKLGDVSDIYCGYRDVELTGKEEIGNFSDNGLDEVKGTIFEELFPNECVQVSSNGKKMIFRRRRNALIPIRVPNEIWSLKSKNREQAYALDLLLDPTIPLVTLSGRSGCGKTLLAMASALDLVINQKKFSKVEVYRPIQAVGADIGFTPGSVAEKIAPWMGSIYNALEFLVGDDYESVMYQYKDKIKLEAITYIRGKSMNKTFIIGDEMQNISRNDIKTILTRVGFDTKIVLTGDIEQIDNHYLDATNNGLTYVIETFKNSDLAGHITLVKGERSILATEASRLL